MSDQTIGDISLTIKSKVEGADNTKAFGDTVRGAGRAAKDAAADFNAAAASINAQSQGLLAYEKILSRLQGSSNRAIFSSGGVDTLSRMITNIEGGVGLEHVKSAESFLDRANAVWQRIQNFQLLDAQRPTFWKKLTDAGQLGGSSRIQEVWSSEMDKWSGPGGRRSAGMFNFQNALSGMDLTGLARMREHFTALAAGGKDVGRQINFITEAIDRLTPKTAMPGLTDLIRQDKGAWKPGQRATENLTGFLADRSQTDLNNLRNRMMANYEKNQNTIELIDLEIANRRRQRENEYRDQLKQQGFGESEILRRLSGHPAIGMGRGSGFRSRASMMNVAYGVEDFMVGYQLGGLPMAMRSSMNNVTAIMAQQQNPAAAFRMMMLANVGMGAYMGTEKLVADLRDGKDAGKELDTTLKEIQNTAQRQVQLEVKIRGINDLKSFKNALEGYQDGFREHRLNRRSMLAEEQRLEAITSNAPGFWTGLGDKVMYGLGQSSGRAWQDQVDAVTADNKLKLLREEIAGSYGQDKKFQEEQARIKALKPRYEAMDEADSVLKKLGKDLNKAKDLTPEQFDKMVADSQAKAASGMVQYKFDAFGRRVATGLSMNDISIGRAHVREQYDEFKEKNREQVVDQWKSRMNAERDQALSMGENLIGGIDNKRMPWLNYLKRDQDIKETKGITDTERSKMYEANRYQLAMDNLRATQVQDNPLTQTIMAGSRQEMELRKQLATPSARANHEKKMEDLTADVKGVLDTLVDEFKKRLETGKMK